MVICTRVVLGTRETPRFVSKSFFDAVQFTTCVNQFDCTLHPETIRYYIPYSSVVERIYHPCEEYTIQIDDAHRSPRCRRRNVLSSNVYKLKQASRVFDRMHITTEDIISSYFLLLPDAKFYHTEIWKEWNTSHVLYDGVVWDIHFRTVYVDPHTSKESVWFVNRPRYQIEISVNMDLRHDPRTLKKSILAILPRAFKWPIESGET